MLGYSQAQLCASISDTAINAFVLFAVISAYQIVFAGYLVAKSSMPEHIRWMVYTTYTRWCTGQLMMSEYGGLLGQQGDLFLTLYDYDNMDFYRSRNVLCVYLAGFQLLIFLAFLPRRSSVGVISVEEANLLIHPNQSKIKDSNEVVQNKLLIKNDDCEKDIENGIKEDLLDGDEYHVPIKSRSSFADRATDVLCRVPSLHMDILNPQGSTGSRSKSHDSHHSNHYTGEEIECHISKTLPKSKQVNFVFRNVNYMIAGHKYLLQDVNGAVSSGELCAVMGSTGSGNDIQKWQI